MKIKFDIESAYGDSDKYIKRKINKYGDKVNTHFHGKKVPKENTSYKYLLLIMQDSVVKVNKKYYPQTLLEECVYEIKNNKMGSLINDDVEPSLFDNETESDSDNGTDNESDNEPKRSNHEFSALRERCPNTDFFLLCVFLYIDGIQENTDHKKLRI